MGYSKLHILALQMYEMYIQMYESVLLRVIKHLNMEVNLHSIYGATVMLESYPYSCIRVVDFSSLTYFISVLNIICLSERFRLIYVSFEFWVWCEKQVKGIHAPTYSPNS